MILYIRVLYLRDNKDDIVFEIYQDDTVFECYQR